MTRDHLRRAAASLAFHLSLVAMALLIPWLAYGDGALRVVGRIIDAILPGPTPLQ